MASSSAERRLKSVSEHILPSTGLIVVLPDWSKVSRTNIGPVNATRLDIDGKSILDFTVVADKTFVWALSAVGTPHEGATRHIPKNPLIQLSSASPCSIPDFWAAVYALFTLYHTQEHIPITTSGLQNASELDAYLFESVLGRRLPYTKPELSELDHIIFLDRSAFWQGAGTLGYHTRTWIPRPRQPIAQVMSFTRKDNVVAKHPVRPAKPGQGEVVYRRWCSAVGQMLELAHFDLEGATDAQYGFVKGADGASRHLAAFHKWHNDERVSAAWGEQGSLEKHRQYIEGLNAGGHSMPCMYSWDGQLFGYIEINFTKEDHMAPYFALHSSAGEWDRNVHILVGETKYLGRSEIWMRSLIHYCLLADPRTNLIIGEPNATNIPTQRLAITSGYNKELIFDFPYKRSSLVTQSRDKFTHTPNLR